MLLCAARGLYAGMPTAASPAPEMSLPHACMNVHAAIRRARYHADVCSRPGVSAGRPGGWRGSEVCCALGLLASTPSSSPHGSFRGADAHARPPCLFSPSRYAYSPPFSTPAFLPLPPAWLAILRPMMALATTSA